ncbi:MAG: ATP-binding protein [Planctomycetota bacterium]
MPSAITSSPAGDHATERTAILFRESQSVLHRQTDRLFARLMICQWLAGVIAALWISPRTWAGTISHTHWHVWAAVFLGGAITGFPVLLVWRHPGRALTRHTIAVAQMLTSALLIHLTGGRIETHFHVFGSLAFIAFYRDWRLLVSATIVVAVDHLWRGLYWPQSVFGVLAPSPWRWLEHAGWVLFEDVFLLVSIRQSLAETLEVAKRADLEAVNRSMQQQTRELQLEVEHRIATQQKLEEAHKQLLATSRQAGMAEVATSVLHNVGNVLNSVNVASLCVADNLRRSKAAGLSRAVALLREHATDLGAFLTSDPRGKQLPNYLAQLSEHLASEQSDALKELGQLQKNIEHINDIVMMQQSYARVSGVVEAVKVSELVEDALRMNAGALIRHDVQIARELDDGLSIVVDKHKVLQILINLIRNAKYACDESHRPDKQVAVRVSSDDGRVRIAVSDNGIGIPSANLTRIFNHGFTTRKNGHGFGLHSGALAAKEMGGALSVHSDGPGQGATFVLELPLKPMCAS